jgi:hypothetical protein
MNVFPRFVSTRCPIAQQFTANVHDNGGRPIAIHVRGTTLSYTVNSTNTTHVVSNDVVRFWPGYCFEDPIDNGNAFLCELATGEYIAFEMSLFRFRVPYDVGRITHFAAYLGNSDVPYPVAYTDTSCAIFIPTRSFIRTDSLPERVSDEFTRDHFLSPTNASDTGGLFYDHLHNVIDGVVLDDFVNMLPEPITIYERE